MISSLSGNTLDTELDIGCSYNLLPVFHLPSSSAAEEAGREVEGHWLCNTALQPLNE